MSDNKRGFDDWGFIGSYDPQADSPSDPVTVNKPSDTRSEEPFVLPTDDNVYVENTLRYEGPANDEPFYNEPEYDRPVYRAPAVDTERLERTLNGEKSEMPLVIVLAFFAALLLIGAFVTLGSAKSRSSSYNDFVKDAVGVTATCSNITKVHTSKTYTHYADLYYVYNGKSYSAKRVSVDTSLKEGDSIRLLVDPKNPENVRKASNAGQGLTVELAMGYTLLVIGGLISAVAVAAFVKYKKKRNKPETADSYSRSVSRKPLFDMYTGDSQTANSASSFDSGVDSGSSVRKVPAYSSTQPVSSRPETTWEMRHIGSKSSSAPVSVNTVRSASSESKSDPKSYSEFKKVFICILVFMLIVELGITLANIVPIIVQKNEWDSFRKKAVAVDAVCTSVRVDKRTGSSRVGKNHAMSSSSTTYKYYAMFSYSYNGRSYSGGEFEISDGIVEGQHYSLYIDPDNPSDVRKEYVVNKTTIIIYSLGFIFAVIMEAILFGAIIQGGKSKDKNYKDKNYKDKNYKDKNYKDKKAP